MPKVSSTTYYVYIGNCSRLRDNQLSGVPRVGYVFLIFYTGPIFKLVVTIDRLKKLQKIFCPRVLGPNNLPRLIFNFEVSLDSEIPKTLSQEPIFLNFS